MEVLLSQFKTNDSKKANLTSITGGKWEIPEKSVKELYKLIRQTQKVGDIVPPLAEGIGNTFPLVLDIDIKYKDKHTDRQYTLSTVKEFTRICMVTYPGCYCNRRCKFRSLYYD